MTTIAWDGKVLAADRMANTLGLPRTVSKFHDCGSYIYAGCGPSSEIRQIAEWIRRGAKLSELVTTEEGGGFGIAVHKATGAAYHVVGKRPVLVRYFDEKQADGSGRDFALAAMAFGKDAADAVRFAATFNVDTGSDVEVYRVAEKMARHPSRSRR